METGLPPNITPEPPKDSVVPIPATPLNQGNPDFTSGIAGGEGNGTAATNKSEVVPPVDVEVSKYMAVVKEVLSLAEGDPNREAKLLELMSKIEAAKANGEMEASVIGEGKDRAVIFTNPGESLITEPAHIPMMVEERIGLRVGDMVTVRDEYLALNRKGFTGLALTKDQQLRIDPDAEMFTAEGSNYSGGQYGVDHFQRQFGRWLGDCQRDAKQNGLKGEGRVQALMQRKEYQTQPDVNPDPKNIQNYRQAGQDWQDSDYVRPDGLWAGFIDKNENDMDTPSIRSPRGRWFDVGGSGYTPFTVEKAETVERVLEKNVRKEKPTQAQTISAVVAPQPQIV